MSEEKDVSSRIHEFHLVVVELTKEGMPLPEPFVTGSLIEKLPESWSDYKSMMKHKRKDMTLEDVIVHIRIKEKNRSREKAVKAKEFTSKANLIEERHDRPHGNHNRQNNRFGQTNMRWVNSQNWSAVVITTILIQSSHFRSQAELDRSVRSVLFAWYRYVFHLFYVLLSPGL
ncbi:hypothetical protein RJ639_008497 [Escallonia herrerae]|uniref:Uncharacterized protein n=1 Tax=Escallonia herrerae TaxID=1293975 RepID=A0AA88VRT5_9ASTE|nr:hypothetical protein RJ639_008497 [Escallonia herrerae]